MLFCTNNWKIFHENHLLCVAEIVFCIKRIFGGPVPEKKPMNHRTRENGGSLCTLHSKSPFDPEEGNT
jgi:hypothetical protein